jgi:hypothetical protein
VRWNCDAAGDGGPGGDRLHHGGSGAPVKMNGDDGFNRCIFRPGDELVNCQD